MISVICPCGKEFKTWPKNIRKGCGKFCSRECATAWRKEHPVKKRRRMNEYEVHGDYTIVYLHRKDGTICKAVIDTADLEKVTSFPNAWYSQWSTKTKSFVAVSQTHINGKRTTILLHRFIMNAPKNMQIDHVNHDTLDERRANLRVVSNDDNQQNHKGARSNSRSGIRGAVWYFPYQKWVAQCTVKGKRYFLGYYDTAKEAGKVAAETRARLMPYSLDAMDESEIPDLIKR